MSSSTARNPWIKTSISVAVALSLSFGTAVSATETKVINNSALRFGNGTEDSLTGDGLLKQPFYYSSGADTFYKLTFGTYALDMAVGFGTGGSNWTGNTVYNIASTSPVTNSFTADYSGLTATGGGITGGWGTVTAQAGYSIGGTAVTIDHNYSLGQNDDYIRIETTLTNNSSNTMPSAGIWVGTQDDYVGSDDSPVKKRGNVSDQGFTQISNSGDASNAIQITSGNEGVLFYSVSENAASVISTSLRFQNVYNQNPSTSVTNIEGDDAYGMYLPVGSLAAGASASIVWFYAAGSIQDLETVTQQVAAAGAAEQGLDSVSSTSGVLNYEFSYDGEGYWMVVPRGATAPTGAEVVAGVDYGDVTVVSADSGAVTANTERTFDLTGLSGSTEYTVYTATVYDDPDNPGTDLTSDPESVDFVTLAEAPVINSITAGDEQVSVDISQASTVTNFEYSIDGGSTWVTRNPVSTASPWVITGLTNGTSYSFTFRGIFGGTPGVSTAASTVAPSSLPTTPQSLQVSYGETSGATASWSAPSSDGGDTVTGYTVQLDTGSGFETVSSTGTTVTLDSVWLDQTWSVRVAANNTNGSGAFATYSNTAPVPQALADPPDNSTLVTDDNQSSITATAGQSVAGSISSGVVTPVTSTITRVTAEAVNDIRTETDTLITAFNNRWGGAGLAPDVVSKHDTETGAKVFGLVAHPENSTPIGVPAKDVILVATDNEAVMMAATKGSKTATVNTEGSLVVETGSTLGFSVNGYEASITGELVILSTPTVLGTFTTDANGSFTGQAALPDGVSAGNHTVVVITAGKVTAFGLQISAPSIVSSPEPVSSSKPYTGPVPFFNGLEMIGCAVDNLVITGTTLYNIDRVTVGGIEVEFEILSSRVIQIELGCLPAGEHDLTFHSRWGDNSARGQLVIIDQPEAPKTIQRINAGSFKGFVAIYALGYEGKRLSAKVGKDWVIVDEIPKSPNNLFRVTDFTGSGVDINLRIFIDRELVMTMPLKTK